MKILITNIVTLNGGDAAILYATMDVLRAAFGKDIQFIVYDKNGEVPARYYPDVVFRKLLYFCRQEHRIHSTNRLLRAIDHGRFKLGLWVIKHDMRFIPRMLLANAERRNLLNYKTADLIVSGGGTYLVENYSLDARIFDYQLSLYFERPLVFFTQSLGPFSNTSNRRLLAPIFEKSVLILVRDKQSALNLTDLGVRNENVHLSADAAFALSDVPAVKSAVNPQKRARRLRVVISVREWRYFKSVAPPVGMNQYREALRTLTRHLVERHNAEVTYLSTCQGMPEYWTDDSKIATTIVEGLGANIRKSVSVDSDFHHPVALAKILKDYDLVIATRMHMAILALGMGTPVLPIAYEFKMHELFERLGLGDWVFDIESISGQALIDGVDLFLERLPEIRPILFTAVQEEYESARASGRIVKEAFERWEQSKST